MILFDGVVSRFTFVLTCDLNQFLSNHQNLSFIKTRRGKSEKKSPKKESTAQSRIVKYLPKVFRDNSHSFVVLSVLDIKQIKKQLGRVIVLVG